MNNQFQGIEKCPLKIYNEYQDASVWVAEEIIHLMHSQERVTLGLCAGSSPTNWQFQALQPLTEVEIVKKKWQEIEYFYSR